MLGVTINRSSRTQYKKYYFFVEHTFNIAALYFIMFLKCRECVSYMLFYIFYMILSQSIILRTLFASKSSTIQPQHLGAYSSFGLRYCRR